MLELGYILYFLEYFKYLLQVKTFFSVSIINIRSAVRVSFTGILFTILYSFTLSIISLIFQKFHRQRRVLFAK